MIKTIIFDLGGVLIDNPNKGMFDYFGENLGLPYETLFPSLVKFWKAWESGLITESELWQKIGTDLNTQLPVNEPHWLNAYLPTYKERPEMFALLATLKSRGYQTALLSNIEDPIKQYIQSKKYRHLDEFIFSCELKMSKPDKEIYQHTLNVLQITPAEAVFVDDRKENIEAAELQGIKGILFESYEDLITQLTTLKVL